MGKGILYIAMTLDGYIAREDGWLDWLNDIPNPDNLDYGYTDFISGIDTIIMGRVTYMEILGFDVKWPYQSCTTYVMSRDPDVEIKTPNTHSINGLSPETISKLHAKSEKNIWILWWWSIVSQCLDLDVIDEMILTIVPVVLWKWIKLFPNIPKETSFSLVKTESFDTGIVALHYKKII